MWLPGVGATKPASGSISNSRMSGVRSRTARSRAGCQSRIWAMLLGRLARDVHRVALLRLQHAVDHPSRPERPGIDVEIVERHARIAVDRLLLRLEHRMILVVNAVAIVDVGALDVARELIVLAPEGAHEVPEVMAARVGL